MCEIMECLGCRLANKMEQVFIVYENEYVSCILDHIPFNEGHILILPKKHIRELDEMDDEIALAIMKASILMAKTIKTVYRPDGIVINQNGGVFNELEHYHLHVVPRYKHQNFADFYMDYDGVNQMASDEQQKKTLKRLKDVVINIINQP